MVWVNMKRLMKFRQSLNMQSCTEFCTLSDLVPSVRFYCKNFALVKLVSSWKEKIH